MCAALEGLTGVSQVRYLQEMDLFEVRHDPGQVSIDDIFAAVSRAGTKFGQEYFPKVLA